MADENMFWFLTIVFGILLFIVIAFGGDGMDDYD
jgi:hypothetical protein